MEQAKTQGRKKPKLKFPLKPHLLLSNDDGWEKPTRLSEEALMEIFAQLREELLPNER